MGRRLLFGFMFGLLACALACSNPEYDNDQVLSTPPPVAPDAASSKPKRETLITEISVGRAFIGMTMDELKQAYPECRIEEVVVEEFGIDGNNKGLLLLKEERPFLFAWTNQGETEIKGIVALTTELRTEQGYHVGMTSGEVASRCPSCYIAPDMLDPRIEYVPISGTEIRLEFLTSDSTRIGRYKYHQHEPKSRLLITDRKVDRISIIAGQDKQ